MLRLIAPKSPVRLIGTGRFLGRSLPSAASAAPLVYDLLMRKWQGSNPDGPGHAFLQVGLLADLLGGLRRDLPADLGRDAAPPPRSDPRP